MMVTIETDRGVIEAMDIIEGIPIDPVHPPSLEMIDPHRRWMIEAERVWMDRSWIVRTEGGCVVHHLRGSGYRPEVWGRFRTPAEAADYVTRPLPSIPVAQDDGDMDF